VGELDLEEVVGTGGEILVLAGVERAAGCEATLDTAEVVGEDAESGLHLGVQAVALVGDVPGHVGDLLR